eukprot:Nk52_evm31s2340 gene=Nk52_evmTU31s2340
MDYFRAILKSGEISERAFDLVGAVCETNSGNYTAWHHRRFLLKHLKKSIEEELDFAGRIISESPKNYQVWHHRKCLIEMSNNPGNECEFINSALKKDSKNYHAWTHRLWVVRTYKLWEGELEATDKLIEEDVRNNSAWCYRFFLLFMREDAPALKDQDILGEEIDMVLELIKKVPSNESCWNYLRGIFNKGAPVKYASFPNVKETCKELMSEEAHCSSPFPAKLLIDILKEEGESSFSDAEGLCDLLANELDPIRSRYWQFVKTQIRS